MSKEEGVGEEIIKGVGGMENIEGIMDCMSRVGLSMND